MRTFVAFGAVTVAVLLSATVLVVFTGIAASAVLEHRHRAGYAALEARARALRAELDRAELSRELNTVHGQIPYRPDIPQSLN